MNSFSLRLDLRFVCLLLLAVIAGMLAIWKPWQTGSADKTISVQGETVLKKAPDEFVFNPNYEKSAATPQEAVAQVSVVGNEVVAKLKALGVAESQIKTTVANGKQYYALSQPAPPEVANEGQLTATYSLTVTVNDQALAQKVQDYLATTATLYGVSPQSSFADATRQALETEARSKAIADAKAKAEQTVKELGAKLGKVVSVSEVNESGPIPIFQGRAVPDAVQSNEATSTSPVLLTGEQELHFYVTVVYALR